MPDEVSPSRMPLIPPVTIEMKNKERLRLVRIYYYVQRWSIDEIVDGLKKKYPQENISKVTILKDISRLRKSAKDFGQKATSYYSDIQSFIFEMNDNYAARIKSLWQEHGRCAESRDRLNLLKEIREQEKHYWGFLQDFGILPTLKTIKPEGEGGIHYISHLKSDEDNLHQMPAPKSFEQKAVIVK